jgi:RNA-binding protein
MLTSKQRAYLIGLSNGLGSILQIGKGGVGPEAAEAAEEAFHNRELIKINILKTSPDEPDLAADKLSKRTKSEIVKVIGRKVVLYRPFKDEPQIILPKK